MTVVDIAGGVMTLTGRYRPGAQPATMKVDAVGRETHLMVAVGDVASRRWLDWVARVFFGTRLLHDGWLLLHASAVRVVTSVGERALVVLAGQRGGKSTIAHRACVERGAVLMADDLVLLRPERDGVTVVGWPTRVCVPAELLGAATLDALPSGALQATVVAGQERHRLVVSPPEHERLFGIGRAGLARLGGILVISPRAGAAPARADIVDSDRIGEVLVDAARVPSQRLMMLDLLGVAGLAAIHAAPPSTAASQVGELTQALRQVPVVGLDLADAAQLPWLPLWDLLDPWLPLLRDCR
ncbi:MAG TPA: hypothetical protein VIY28_18625 [Pseudonocardiaceae bacterium]